MGDRESQAGECDFQTGYVGSDSKPIAEPISQEEELEGPERDGAPVGPREGDALEEVVFLAPQSVDGGVVVSSTLTKSAIGRRQGRRDLPLFVPAKIDDVRIDSRYGEVLWESGLFQRLIPRPDLLDEEGIRQLSRQLPIHVTRANNKFDAFGGIISHELALRGLRTSREIPVLLYESVSEEEKRVFAIFEQLMIRALMIDDDQISVLLLNDLLRARVVCPSLFQKPGKEDFVRSFGRSPRSFRAGKGKAEKTQ